MLSSIARNRRYQWVDAFLNNLWYGKRHILNYILLPITWGYQAIILWRGLPQRRANTNLYPDLPPIIVAISRSVAREKPP